VQKPLGTGFTGVPMRGVSLRASAPFADERMSLAMNLFIASGTQVRHRDFRTTDESAALSGLQQ